MCAWPAGWMTVMTQPDCPVGEEYAKGVEYALLDDGQVAVMRVTGRGNFQNSVSVRQFAQCLASEGKPEKFIMDLGNCETLDSTFMGVLASLSLQQERSGRKRLVLVKANEHIQKLLKTLGLARLLEIRANNACSTLEQAEGKLEPARQKPVSHEEQIAHTLEAHRILVSVDEDNEVRFQSVINYLEKSLDDGAI